MRGITARLYVCIMEIGNTINHKDFGAGVIVAIEEKKVAIKFDNYAHIIKLSFDAYKKGTSTVVKESKSAAKKWAVREMVISEEEGLIADLEMWGSATQQRNGDTAVIIFTVSSGTGFAADVAKTCLKYGKVSQKQAAIIAKAYLSK